jgi:uncharacterized RDD family membrane protein YckC
VLDNPYAPPKHEAEGPNAPRPGRASRGKRVGAFAVDAVVQILVAGVLSNGYTASSGDKLSRLQFATLITAVQVAQWIWIASRGQTLGKMLFRTRIVRLDGTLPGFVRGVVVRTWPLVGLYFMQIVSTDAAVASPGWKLLRMACSLTVLADQLFAFRDDHRCLHDHLAGTYVKDCAAERDARPRVIDDFIAWFRALFGGRPR